MSTATSSARSKNCGYWVGQPVQPLGVGTSAPVRERATGLPLAPSHASSVPSTNATFLGSRPEPPSRMIHDGTESPTMAIWAGPTTPGGCEVVGALGSTTAGAGLW